MTKDNIKQFIELYNTLDSLLRERYKETSRSFSMINRYINYLERSTSEELNKKARKINMIRILRNDLVHEFDLNSENLVNVSDETIDFLKKEIEILKNPITAYKICTKLKDLYIVNQSNEIKDVIKYMSSHGFTQVPVISDSHLVGVFSPNVMFSYFSKNDIDKAKGLTIRDFMDYIPCKKHISEKYEFIDRNATLDEVTELFDDSHRENKKLAAIFVTEQGYDTDKILGMIVPYDILKNV